jgi:hypothetical protein
VVVPPPENNPFKLPLFLACAFVGAVMAVVGALSGAWLYFVIGLVLLLISLGSARVIRQGRNPWWIRAPLDRRRPPRH